MKTRFTLSLMFFTLVSFAQTAKDYAVQVKASVTSNPPSVSLQWPSDTTGLNYIVYRKEKNEINWGNPLATLPKTATQYSDNTVAKGNAYEYYVRRTYASTSRFAHGYIFVGIEAPELVAKGKILLMVDANYVTPLAN